MKFKKFAEHLFTKRDGEIYDVNLDYRSQKIWRLESLMMHPKMSNICSNWNR